MHPVFVVPFRFRFFAVLAVTYPFFSIAVPHILALICLIASRDLLPVRCARQQLEENASNNADDSSNSGLSKEEETKSLPQIH